MNKDEQKIANIVKNCYNKFDNVKIIEGRGTLNDPYHIIIFSIHIEEFEHTLCANNCVTEVMNVTCLTKQLTKKINEAGFKNFRLYMVPKWY